MSFIYIRRKKLFIPVVSHLVETWENLTCDQTFFFFFSLKARKAWVTYIGIIERRHDLRLGETRKWPQKCENNNNNKPLKSWMMLHFRSSFAVEQLLIWRLKKLIKSSLLFNQNTSPFLLGLIQAWFHFVYNSRKYPYPPRRDLEIPWGWVVRGPGHSRGEGGWTINPLSRG